jgi:hypothetical protein
LRKRNKRTKNKQKEKNEKNEKPTKEAETSKARDEKQTRLKSAWTLLRELFRWLPGRLLRESEG